MEISNFLMAFADSRYDIQLAETIHDTGGVSVSPIPVRVSPSLSIYTIICTQYAIRGVFCSRQCVHGLVERSWNDFPPLLVGVEERDDDAEVGGDSARQDVSSEGAAVEQALEDAEHRHGTGKSLQCQAKRTLQEDGSVQHNDVLGTLYRARVTIFADLP